MESLYIFDWHFDKEALHILTIEGKIISLDLQTGKLISNERVSPVLRWFQAELIDVKGLDERNTYLLNILGAINLPNSQYDPWKDQKLFHYDSHKSRKKPQAPKQKSRSAKIHT